MNSKFLMFLFGFVLLFYNCKQKKGLIHFKQIEANTPVYIRIDTSTNKIIKINFLFKLEIENKSSEKISFSSIGYKNSDQSFSSSLLYKFEEGSQIIVSQDKYKNLPQSEPKEYILLTQHNLNNNQSKSLKKYLTTLDSGQNKINIGQISQFKKDEKLIYENLLNDDSLSLRVKIGSKIKHMMFPVKIIKD